jgi:hypothetical protein
MNSEGTRRFTAFDGDRKIATGELRDVAVAVKRAADGGATGPLFVFSDDTAKLVDIDLRGSDRDVLARLGFSDSSEAPATTDRASDETPAHSEARGRGRPKLGVVAREVTLLPRHWEWLNGQPGGASVALRRLVDEARRHNEHRDRARESREAAYRFMSAMAGDRAGFEEATRALFAGDASRFESLVSAWPRDIASHALELANPSFAREAVTA